MGNKESHEEIVQVRSVSPLRDASGRIVGADEDDEVMVALSSTPAIEPLLIQSVSFDELESLFDTTAPEKSRPNIIERQEIARFDPLTVMRLQTAWQTHVRNSAIDCSEQQERMRDKLFECDRRAAKTLRIMQDHTLIVTDLVALLPHVSLMIKGCRDAHVRIQMLMEAA